MMTHRMGRVGRFIARAACSVSFAIPLASSAQMPEELFRQRKYDEARAAFQTQLAKNKSDANALFYLGRIAMEQEKWSDATDWFEKAVKANDTSATYHYWLGASVGEQAQRASKLKQPFMARRIKSEFERAVQLDGRMIDPRMGLVNFYSMAPGVMGGSMDKAREQATEIGKMNRMMGHRAMVRIAQREKDNAAMEREYRAAVADSPDSAWGYNNLANFLRSQSRFDEAFAISEELMKRRPDEPGAHLQWGVTAAMSGKRLDRGEKEIAYWLDNRPNTATPQGISGVRYWLGQLYEKSGKAELAKAQYDEAVTLNPQNADARKARAALK
jgi:tetratricopeptide (TPR) repeat protein